MDEVDRILSMVPVDTGDVFAVDPLSMMHEGFKSSELGSDRGSVGIASSLSASQHGDAPGSHHPDLPPGPPRNSIRTNLKRLTVDGGAHISGVSGVHVQVTGTAVELGSVFSGHGIRTSEDPVAKVAALTSSAVAA